MTDRPVRHQFAVRDCRTSKLLRMAKPALAGCDPAGGCTPRRIPAHPGDLLAGALTRPRSEAEWVAAAPAKPF